LWWRTWEYQASKYFFKTQTSHFVPPTLVLDRVAELTPRNKKPYSRIQKSESALCKLRNVYRAKNLKEVCQLDSNLHTVLLIFFERRYFKIFGI
jgi:hypothetical protein